MKLARHTLLNLLGLGAPLLLAVLAIPALLRGLGADRFGLLALMWAITSYFGLFDLGLGRALTLRLATVFERGRLEDVGPLSATALILLAVLGLVGAALLVLVAPWGSHWVSASGLRHEVLLSTLAMAAALPAVMLTAGFRGVLEARQRFDLVNWARLPLGLWTFAGPWMAMAWLGPDLLPVTVSLVLGRWLALVVHVQLVWADLPYLKRDLRWSDRWLRPLLTTGGWMTLSNVVSPFMGYVDRFLIAGLLSAGAVAYYATPLEVVIKLSVVPAALSAALFPSLAAQLVRDVAGSWKVCEQALVWLAVAMAFTAVPLALTSAQVLHWWVGAEVAAQSSVLMQIFCLGIAVNSLAHVPLTLLQSGNAVRLPALLHCLELPLFLIALWVLIARFGLQGAASAWLLRMVLDSVLLFIACVHHYGRASRAMLSGRLGMALFGLALGFGASQVRPWLSALMIIAMVVVSLAAIWPDLIRIRRGNEGVVG